MRCPYCGEDNDRVVDSRSMADSASIRRRRECLNCHQRFTTYERVEELPLVIIKHDRRREPYDHEKVAKGIRIACQKRPISEDQIQTLSSEIERELFEPGIREVESSQVGEKVMERLRELDQVAYVRFASVYRQFKDVSQFIQELSQMMNEDEKKAIEPKPMPVSPSSES